MLYMSGDKVKIIILESSNLDELRKGHAARTPDGSVLIAWCPDPVWLADKIMDTKGDGAAIGKLIVEASKRPEKPSPRPRHAPHVTRFDKEDRG
jgi:hypothetical protein